MQDFNNTDNNGDEPKNSWVRNLNPFGYVILVLAIIFFTYQIIGGSIAFFAGGAGLDSDIPLSRIVLAFGQFMLILAPTIFFTRLRTPYLKETFRLNAPSPFLVLLAILGIILIQPALQGYLHLQEFILNHLPFFNDAVKQLKEVFELIDAATMKIVTAYSPVEFAVVAFVIGLTPAICEEFLFRGFVLKNLESVARPAIAIFFSGFLFAVYHFQPFNIIPLVLLGFYLGFVVYYSDSIFTGIICHFLNNFFAAFYIYKYGKDEFDTPNIADSQIMNTAITGIISLILFVIVLIIFHRLRTKPKPMPDDFE